jgi:hypothetical protein
MSYKDDAAKSRVEKLKHYADGGEVGVGEKVARYLSGGRDFAQRKFYNDTRGSSPMAMGEIMRGETTPESQLASRRLSDMLQSERISDAVPRRKDDE